MIITDGRKTVEITIRRWNGNGYDPDCSADYFEVGGLPYNEESGAYTVDDVDYCIDMANSVEGACGMCDDITDEIVRDEDMTVFVTVMD